MDILFEDSDIIVCYKPAGLATQTRSIGQKDMVSELMAHVASQGIRPDIHVIHRLDQPVEGVMVFAKNAKAAASLSKQVQQGDFGKRYYALVSKGNIAQEGVLEDYIIKDNRTNLSSIADKNQKAAKAAKLSYHIIEELEDSYLVDIKLDTGRHHQIRLQFSSRGLPIIGDIKYGGISTGRPLALCSYFIGFKHPVSDKRMEYRIEPRGLDFTKGGKI